MTSKKSVSSDQPSLLTDTDLKAVRRSQFDSSQPAPAMTQTELQQWQQRVARFQRQRAIAPPPQQGSLLAAEAPGDYMASPAVRAEDIDPFALPRQNTEFWRWQFNDAGAAALYFVMDFVCAADGQTVGLLLYVGETVKSNQRWKGVHDCKRYLENYRQVHYQHSIPSQLSIAFWPQAPTARKPRQRLELALIRRWRSPFNKENWQFWQTPFVGDSTMRPGL